MATVVFYEKPGCINNTRQKKLLVRAGHEVTAKDILAHPWTRESLGLFFDGLDLADCFNRSAPRISSGEIRTEELDREEAMALMIADPLLIRRPLLEVNGERRVGFDVEAVDAWIGLNAERPGDDYSEACPRKDGHVCAGGNEE